MKKSRKRRIAVVGIPEGKTPLVSRKCGDLVDLRFIDRDRADQSWPEADDIILMARFIEHRWTKAAYRNFPRDRVHRHYGGISGLVEQVNRLGRKHSHQNDSTDTT